MSPIFELLYVLVGIVALFFAARAALQGKFRLDRRLAEFKEEQKRHTGAVINPYEGLAEIYQQQAHLDEEARQRSYWNRLRRWFHGANKP